MKKVLVVFTSIHFPPHVLKFVTSMAASQTWHLQGVFMDDDPSHVNYPFPSDFEIASNTISDEVVRNADERIEQIDARIFRKACEASNISFEIRTDMSLSQLIEESSSADLMITDTRMEFYQSSFTDLLGNAACPVCLVSSDTLVVSNVIMAYDGSDKSKYAIERFIFLFPQFNNLPAYLVSVNIDQQSIEQDDFIANVANHFRNLSFHSLSGDVNKELESFLNKYIHSAIVVLGAFGRNFLSTLFHKSVGNEVLAKTSASLFIARE